MAIVVSEATTKRRDHGDDAVDEGAELFFECGKKTTATPTARGAATEKMAPPTRAEVLPAREQFPRITAFGGARRVTASWDASRAPQGSPRTATSGARVPPQGTVALPLCQARKSCYVSKIMALPDATPYLIAKEVDRGATFEVWRSQLGVMRLDWNRQGAVLETFLGYGSHEFATIITRRWEVLRRGGVQLLMLADFWEMPNYDSGVRTIQQEWILKNRSSVVQPFHVLSRSKMVGMATAVANLALGGIITSHTQRHTFDVIVKKAGLMACPPMPLLPST